MLPKPYATSASCFQHDAKGRLKSVNLNFCRNSSRNYFRDSPKNVFRDSFRNCFKVIFRHFFLDSSRNLFRNYIGAPSGIRLEVLLGLLQRSSRDNSGNSFRDFFRNYLVEFFRNCFQDSSRTSFLVASGDTSGISPEVEVFQMFLMEILQDLIRDFLYEYFKEFLQKFFFNLISHGNT